MHPPQSPYLQVALPLIEDVKGGEGLSSLWRVFTKCQESIQDGSRLENISWRLWYKSLHPSSPPCDPSHLHPLSSSHRRRSSASLAGSSFTESVASSGSHLSDRDYFPPQAVDGAAAASAAPLEIHSEPITPSVPPVLPSPPTTHHSRRQAPRPPIVRASSAAAPHHSSLADMTASSSSAAAGSSQTSRPALAVRAKSTPRLKSSSPYEDGSSSRPLEFDSGCISFGRVLGQVYKEGTVPPMVRRAHPPSSSSSASSALPSVRTSITSLDDDNAGRSLSMSSHPSHGRRDGDSSMHPSIRVLEPTPANTTPSSPAPSAHSTLWGSDIHALSNFSFSQPPQGSQDNTPRPRPGARQPAEDLSAASPSLKPSSSRLSASSSSASSDTLGSTGSRARDAIRPIPRHAGGGGPAPSPAAEGKKLFFISPDNGDGSGSCSSLDSDNRSSSGPSVGGPAQVDHQQVGSPESIEDGGLQMKRRGKAAPAPPAVAPVPGPHHASAVASTSQISPRHASPPRQIVSPSYAPLASSPLKQTTMPPSPRSKAATKKPSLPPITTALPPASTATGDQSRPPVRQQSISSATSNTSRKTGGSSKVGPSSKASSSKAAGKPSIARRKSGPARAASASIAMTKSNGPMAPPLPPPAATAAAAVPVAPPLGGRRSSSGSGGGGRFAQEQARAASAINASSQEKQQQTPLASTGSSAAVRRPSLTSRRTSSSALTMTSSRARASHSRPASEHGDDEAGEEEEAEEVEEEDDDEATGAAAPVAGSDEGEWASDTASSEGGKPAPKAKPPARRTSTKGRPTKYTAAAMERARHEAMVRFAEEEAERQKSLFRKVPVSKSAADLYGLGREAAAASPASPDQPEAADFASRGTGNIAGGRSSGLLSDMFKGEREKREGVSHQKASATLGHSRNHSSSQDLWQHSRDVATTASKSTASILSRNKSAAALPQESGFTVGRGDDLETESEAETHGSADKIALGTSEAQRRLALLSSKMPTTTAPRHHGLSGLTAMTPVGTGERHQQHMNYPPTTRPLPPRPDSASPNRAAQPDSSTVVADLEEAQHQQQPVDMPNETLPPLAAAPQSPRTTRRQMLAAELPEELRKQLLWERMSRQRVYGGGTINRSNSTPKLTADVNEADRPLVQRNAATESAPASRAPSDSSSPPPPVKRNTGLLGPNVLRPLTAAGQSPPLASATGQRSTSDSISPGSSNPYLDKVKASRKVGDGPLQAYRSNPSTTNLARLGGQQQQQPSESSSDSEDDEDALTLLRRRNTHHGELNKMANDGWDADYRSHGF